MGSFRMHKQRLPAHLQPLRRDAADSDSDSPRVVTARPSSAPPTPSAETDRLSELLPVILRAMVGGQTDREPPVVIGQPEIFAALAPYYRPRSRFEELMMRKLVGEGYLKPRGARDKSGLSDAYEVTPKGEQLLGKGAL
ncbi:hypothetical protein E7T06_07935 [Deinococcus sp. Arct2-2]|uniref:hypothetical protein n=1 Tax=Deinococcus sp. Arct2-2 TaxID=2568653 RepID=UPI0010A3073B|nr:hypothetical protein [Deinococcus sp. Arct2-2]THF70384.1 hypothetical protein E7T06_07935 [Deinococcus sp. Arct2-2]